MNTRLGRYCLSAILAVVLGFGSSCFAAAALVNVNTASEQQLEQVKGIGPTRAKAIVAYRAQHKQFKSVSELVNVKGIGPKTLEKLRKQLTIAGNAHGAKD